MLYSDIFLNYKNSYTDWKIFMRIKPIRNRIFISFSFVFIVYFGVLFYNKYHDTFSKTVYTLFILLACMFAIVVIFFFLKVEKEGIKDLIKHFPDIKFTELEKMDVNLILTRIKTEWIQSTLGDKKYNVQYIKQLVEFANEYSEHSKIQLVSFKELGLTTVIVLILNNYFSSLYKKWDLLSTSEITSNTFYLSLVFGIFFYFYFGIKKWTNDWLNNDYKQHKNLYQIIKRVEEIAINN